jgi:hypothetical protein
MLRRSRTLPPVNFALPEPSASRRRIESQFGPCSRAGCGVLASQVYRGLEWCANHINEALPLTRNSPQTSFHVSPEQTQIQIQQSPTSPAIGITISHQRPSIESVVDSQIGHLSLPEVEASVRQNYRFSFEVVLEVKATKSGGSVAIFPAQRLQTMTFLEMRDALFNLAKPNIVGKWTKVGGKHQLLTGSGPEHEISYSNYKHFVKVDRVARKKKFLLDDYKEQEMKNDMVASSNLLLLVWKYGPQTLATDATELDKFSLPGTVDRSGAADISYRRTVAEKIKEYHKNDWVPQHSQNWLSWANAVITICREQSLQIDDEIKSDCPETCLLLFSRSTEVSQQSRNLARLDSQSRTTQRLLEALRAEALRTYNEQIRILTAYDTLLQGVREDLPSREVSSLLLQNVESRIQNQEDDNHLADEVT